MVRHRCRWLIFVINDVILNFVREPHLPGSCTPTVYI